MLSSSGGKRPGVRGELAQVLGVGSQVLHSHFHRLSHR